MNYQEIFTSVYKEGGYQNLEEAINKMKEAGASQIDCVRTLVVELKLPLKDADTLVLHSSAWRDEKEITERFRHHIDTIFDKVCRKK